MVRRIANAIVSRFSIAVVILLLVTSGCSREYWLAKFYVNRAENAYYKGYELRVKKGVEEEREEYYRKACSDFLKAYELDPRCFTLTRIISAGDACLRVEDQESVELFRQFEEDYVREHPREAEYGDAAPLDFAY